MIATTKTALVAASLADQGWWHRFTTDPNATFAGAVALFTFGLLVVAVWQGWIILGQMRLARQEFTATHRPRLVVRSVRLESISRNSPPRAWITVANIGDSAALVTSIAAAVGRRRLVSSGENGFYLWLAKPEWKEAAYAPTVDPRLVGGARTEYLVPEREILTEAGILALVQMADELCVVGEVIYTDTNNVERHTGFFRRYDPRYEKFFAPQEGDMHFDMEYID